MTVKEIYPTISSHQITLFDTTTHKVHMINPESVAAILSNIEILELFGDYKVVRLIPLDFQKLQITIKKEG